MCNLTITFYFYYLHMKLFLFFFLFSFSLVGQIDNVLVHKTEVKISVLNQLNSPYRECNLSVSPDGTELFFMSTRPSKINKIGGDGDLYKSRLSENMEWLSPVFLSEVNTTSGEDEPSLSSDGSMLYFQSWKNTWISQDGPYFQAKLENGVLKNPIGLGGGVARFFRDMHMQYLGFGTDGMAISSDGNLFIVACGPDYYGDMDLYYSVRKNGVWTYPELMAVSTKGNERAVFIAADNKTIYFSSDGRGGFGGLDIFKTVIHNGKLGEVVNIGSPFNTTSNDMGFVITKNGNSAFLIRDLDIYFADLTALTEEIKPITAIKDTVTNIPEEPKEERTQQEPEKASYLINFDFDKFTIDSAAEVILNQIKLSHNSGQRIKLIGHTDNRGSNRYNEELSLKRVKVLETWLKSVGFEQVIISAMGETLPLMDNNSEMSRSKNRRVEIRIE
jgi:outer membrane protein OmpA-like peptidoglycan-associated protein